MSSSIVLLNDKLNVLDLISLEGQKVETLADVRKLINLQGLKVSDSGTSTNFAFLRNVHMEGIPLYVERSKERFVKFDECRVTYPGDKDNLSNGLRVDPLGPKLIVSTIAIENEEGESLGILKLMDNMNVERLSDLRRYIVEDRVLGNDSFVFLRGIRFEDQILPISHEEEPCIPTDECFVRDPTAFSGARNAVRVRLQEPSNEVLSSVTICDETGKSVLGTIMLSGDRKCESLKDLRKWIETDGIHTSLFGDTGSFQFLRALDVQGEALPVASIDEHLITVSEVCLHDACGKLKDAVRVRSVEKLPALGEIHILDAEGQKLGTLTLDGSMTVSTLSQLRRLIRKGNVFSGAHGEFTFLRNVEFGHESLPVSCLDEHKVPVDECRVQPVFAAEGLRNGVKIRMRASLPMYVLEDTEVIDMKGFRPSTTISRPLASPSRKIGIAVDNSDMSRFVVGYAMENLLRESDLLVFIHSRQSYVDEFCSFISWFTEKCAELDRSYSYRAISSKEDPRSLIMRVQEEQNLNLVIVGSHGKGILEKMFLGSTCEYVVSYLPCPVVVVKRQSEGESVKLGKRNIAVAIDEHDISEAAFNWTIRNVMREGDTLTLIHVEPDLMYADYESPGARARQIKLLDQYRKLCSRAGVVAKYVPLRGDSRERVVDAVEDKQCDLLVVGNQGKGLAMKWILGSVSDYATKYCPKPTIIVK